MKVAGTLPSLLKGVSQQPPEVREQGQHEDQVNLLSDPITGLTRRRGTIAQAVKSIGLVSPTTLAAMAQSAVNYRYHRFIVSAKEYIMAVASQPDATPMPGVVVYNLTDRVFVPLAVDATTIASVVTLKALGVGAITNLGKYTVFALNNEVMPNALQQVWGVAPNIGAVIWVRGGQYNRTYTVNVEGGPSFSHTTPSASDTASAQAISSQNIAGYLASQALEAGYTIARAIGSHFTISATSNISCSDGGDGTLLRAVSLTVDAVDKLPVMGVPNMVVKVQPSADSVFYVKCIAKVPSAPLSECVWRECAGQIQGTTAAFRLMAVEGGTLRIGSTSGISATNPPVFVKSDAGDAAASVAPAFLGKRPITYLGVFQDRLLVGAGSALAVSAAGDYFNFFRSTMVTLPTKDPFEMISQEGEDDTLRYSVPYNRNHVIFGDRRQYVISGTTALTPVAPNMSVLTNYPDTTGCPPLAIGGQLYYVRDKEGFTSLHQIQPGQFTDAAESFPASAQVSTFIPGPTGQIEAVPTTPTQLILRSKSVTSEVRVFTYLDLQEGRKQAAWSRWVFDPLCGSLMCTASTSNGINFMWLRYSEGKAWIVMDLMPTLSSNGTLPYMDSMRPYTAVVPNAYEISNTSAGWNSAYDKSVSRYLLGSPLATTVTSLLGEFPGTEAAIWVGLPFESSFVPTNPFKRDGEGKAILGGLLTITTVSLTMKDSSGFRSRVEWNDGRNAKDEIYTARLIGSAANIIGQVPVVDSRYAIGIGKESKQYTLRIASRSWLPLTISAIDWVGQSFNRTPRA